MSNMTVRVRFLAGTDIRDAVTEAINKARAWNVAYVCFDFNGLKFSLSPNATIDEVMQEYNNQEKTDKFIVC